MTAEPQQPPNSLFPPPAKHGQATTQVNSTDSLSFEALEQWLADEVLQRIDGSIAQANDCTIRPSLDDQSRFALFLGERAAIHEYDGGSKRHDAEMLALHDALGHFFLEPLLRYVRLCVSNTWAIPIPQTSIDNPIVIEPTITEPETPKPKKQRRNTNSKSKTQ